MPFDRNAARKPSKDQIEMRFSLGSCHCLKLNQFSVTVAVVSRPSRSSGVLLLASTWGGFGQELSGDANPKYFLKSTAVQMGGRTAVQMGGVLLVSPSSRLRSQAGPAIQMGRTAIQIGGVLPYFLVSETLLIWECQLSHI